MVKNRRTPPHLMVENRRTGEPETLAVPRGLWLLPRGPLCEQKTGTGVPVSELAGHVLCGWNTLMAQLIKIADWSRVS